MGDSTNTSTFPGFDACVGFIRNRNRGVHEDGYFWLVDRAHEFVPELISLVEAEQDHFVRVTWIELLGASRDPAVVPTLDRLLAHSHVDARRYAALALEEVATPQALALVEAYRQAHPDEV